jgi:N-acetylglucosamine kinase-like BadF-type ATPase
VSTEEGNTVITGTVTDDGGTEGLNATISGGSGSVYIDEDGHLVINGATPDENGLVTIVVTDLDGNSTTYSFQL